MLVVAQIELYTINIFILTHQLIYFSYADDIPLYFYMPPWHLKQNPLYKIGFY